MASMKIASILAAATLVAGHGYVTNATIGGSSYEFYQPYTDPYTSPTPERVSRPIQGNGPVTDVTLADLQCGGDSADGVVGSSPAALQAGPVAAGSDVELFWTLWPSSHVGPTITYMAKCPDTGCTDYMPNNTAVWFKVQEDGRDGTSDTWGATPLMTAGGSVKYTIPECIEAGDYLVRHEIIALHSAYSYPGAQFYPGCHQIQVTGGGSTSPSNLVSFPGAYKGSDAGITYDAYKAQTYTIPGPELFTCSGSSSSSSSSSSGSSSSAAATAAAATSATTAQASSAPSTLATVTRASSATSSAVAVAAASATTSAVSGDDEDGCGAEETVTSTISAAAAVVTGSGDDGDDECGADEPTTTATASAATATSSDDGGDDDECGADEPTGVVTGSAATTTDSADGSGDDDECGAEEPTATASASAASATSSDDGGDDDECGAEEPTATATGSAASATASAASGDDDECDAEEESAYARRFSGRFARVAV